MTILQRNRINSFLRSGDPLPLPKPKRATTTNCRPSIDCMRAQAARRRSLQAIKASGVLDRDKYDWFFLLHLSPSLKTVSCPCFLFCSFHQTISSKNHRTPAHRSRFIPKKYESWEHKKARLQEEMSGLKHYTSDDERALLSKANQRGPPQHPHTDPIDESKTGAPTFWARSPTHAPPSCMHI